MCEASITEPFQAYADPASRLRDANVTTDGWTNGRMNSEPNTPICSPRRTTSTLACATQQNNSCVPPAPAYSYTYLPTRSSKYLRIRAGNPSAAGPSSRFVPLFLFALYKNLLFRSSYRSSSDDALFLFKRPLHRILDALLSLDFQFSLSFDFDLYPTSYLRFASLLIFSLRFRILSLVRFRILSALRFVVHLSF